MAPARRFQNSAILMMLMVIVSPAILAMQSLMEFVLKQNKTIVRRDKMEFVLIVTLAILSEMENVVLEIPSAKKWIERVDAPLASRLMCFTKTYVCHW